MEAAALPVERIRERVRRRWCGRCEMIEAEVMWSTYDAVRKERPSPEQPSQGFN